MINFYIMNIKSFIPHFIAIGVFLLVTVTYFSPIVFGNKEIFQEDIMRFKGVSKEITDYREKTGQEPMWTNALFGGMPAYQISFKYVSGNLDYVSKILSLGLPHPARVVFLYFLGFYILMLVLRVNPLLAVAGALGYGLSSYFFVIIDAGHNSKAAAIAYIAPVLAGVILTYRGKLMAGGALTALFLTLEIFTNHVQITYYLGILICIYVAVEFVNAIREKQIIYFSKKLLTLFIALLIAIGANITSLWVTADYSQYTIRGGTELTINADGTKNTHNVTSGLDKDYATAWSYGVGETMTLLIPNFKGGSSSIPIGQSEAGKKILSKIDPQQASIAAQIYSQYFGDQPFTSGPVYAGAIIIFLFILGVFIPVNSSSTTNLSSVKWTLIIGTLFFTILSWGKNDPFGISNFIFDYLPMYNKFRTVSMTLVITELCLPVLAILGLDAIIKNKDFLTQNITLPFKQILTGQKILIIVFALSGGVALLCWIAPEMFTNFSSPGDVSEVGSMLERNGWPADQIKSFTSGTIGVAEEARKEIFKADALRSFFFILLAAIAIWLYQRKTINLKVIGSAFIVLILLDMILVDKRYLNNDSFKNKSEMKNPLTAMGRPNQADLDIQKDTDPNYRVWNTMARPDQDAATSYFHKSIGGYHGAKLRRYQELIDFHINRRNMQVINMLNTKYIIVPGDKNQAMVYPNTGALGNAWFVNEYKTVVSPDSEITALNHFNSRTTAIIDKRFESELNGIKPIIDSNATIKLTSYKPNDLIYESNSTSERVAVFSEIYYPSGWNAYIDGKMTNYFRANYVLRAMCIPAGKHTIEYKFEPSIVAKGEKISMTCILLLLFSCVGVGFIEIKKGSLA